MELTLPNNRAHNAKAPQHTAEKFDLSSVLPVPRSSFIAQDREVIHTAAIPLYRRIPTEHLLLLTAPASVIAMSLLAAAFLLATGAAVHAHEMAAAGSTSLLVGLLAVLPLFQAMRLGDETKMIQSTMISIALRITLLLAGTYLAMGPGFGLQPEALIAWTLAFYFPLLAVETIAMALILRQLDAK